MYEFVENLKSDKAFFFYRGSVALYALLKAMKLQPGDEVILQVFTCDAVPMVIVRAEGIPIYVDINPHTFNIDPGKIEEKITDRTRVILVQHTYGIPAEMDRILQIAKKYGLFVIEDSCHAFGSRCCGQEVGTFGDGAFYSFGWHKPLVLGAGGAAVANNPALKQEMERIYNDFVTPSFKETLVVTIQYLAYHLLLTPSLYWPMRKFYRQFSHWGLIAGTRRTRESRTPQARQPQIVLNERESSPVIAAGENIYNKRIIPLQKRRLTRKLDRFEKVIAHQKQLISQYEAYFSQLGFNPLELDNRFEPVFFKYPLLSDHQKEIFKKAPQAQVELSYIFASPLYPAGSNMARLWKSLGYQAGMCPISENVADRIVALPVHTRIQARHIKKTIVFLRHFENLAETQGE